MWEINIVVNEKRNRHNSKISVFYEKVCVLLFENKSKIFFFKFDYCPFCSLQAQKFYFCIFFFNPIDVKNKRLEFNYNKSMGIRRCNKDFTLNPIRCIVPSTKSQTVISRFSLYTLIQFIVEILVWFLFFGIDLNRFHSQIQT